MFKTEIYCEINGEMLSQPDENVSYQSLFRNFVTIELVMSITRTVITGAFLGFIFYIFSKNIKFFESYQDDDGEKKKFNDILMYIIICLSFLIFLRMCLKTFLSNDNQFREILLGIIFSY